MFPIHAVSKRLASGIYQEFFKPVRKSKQPSRKMGKRSWFANWLPYMQVKERSKKEADLQMGKWQF